MNLSGIYRTLATLAVVAAVTLAGCGSGDDSLKGAPSAPPTPTTFTIHGYVDVHAPFVSQTMFDNQRCVPDHRYGVKDGAQVTVTDDAGKVVAVGEVVVDPNPFSPPHAEPDWHCRFDLTVPDVPDGSPFYGLEVARHDAVNYPRRDLDDPVKLIFG
jgi:hypothetical protein